MSTGILLEITQGMLGFSSVDSTCDRNSGKLTPSPEVVLKKYNQNVEYRSKTASTTNLDCQGQEIPITYYKRLFQVSQQLI